jgi:hypothetical protein
MHITLWPSPKHMNSLVCMNNNNENDLGRKNLVINNSMKSHPNFSNQFYEKYNNSSFKYNFNKAKILYTNPQLYNEFHQQFDLSMHEQNLNVSDWALWRAKLNEKIIRDQIGDFSLLRIEPSLVNRIYYINGVNKYENKFLQPEMFILYGLPRAKIHSLLVNNSENHRCKEIESSEENKNSVSNESKTTINSSSGEFCFNLVINKTLSKENEANVKSDTKFEDDKKSSSNVSETNSSSNYQSQSESNNKRQKSLLTSSNEIITGGNVKEKIKVFETNLEPSNSYGSNNNLNLFKTNVKSSQKISSNSNSSHNSDNNSGNAKTKDALNTSTYSSTMKNLKKRFLKSIQTKGNA